jgi:DNA repair protein RecN (Recombination protein N)
MGLRHIALRDFVIVRELDLDFETGFTVLTGETGAGKSILIDAVQLALGARADAGVVPQGATRAEVSVEFDPPPHLGPWLDAGGFDNTSPLLLRRQVDAQGKSRGWINGSPATASQLRELGEKLLDIHGQHAWQGLMKPDAVRRLLDAYGGIACKAMQQRWHEWRKALQALTDAQQAQTSLHQERDRLSWQLGELEKLSPKSEEWTEITTQHARLSNAQALLDAAQTAVSCLEDERQGALRQLSQATETLQRQSHLEPVLADTASVLISSLAQAEDAAHTLHQFLRKTDLDPEGLAVLDERIALWVSLARRYRRTPEDLPALVAQWQVQLAELDAATDLDALSHAEQATQAAFVQEALTVSKARAKAAPKLSRDITQAMQTLGMQGGQFLVALTPLVEPSLAGLESVEFLVSGHAGNPPKPVGKVASGGELSRISLAIAVTTSQLGDAPTLIFDEVDSGIGGAVAQTVGRLMRKLGIDRQVLAVTHLPQVAACGDHHCLVSKLRSADTTTSTVKPIVGTARVTEIARMLGGEKLSDTTLAHAREMLEQE